MSFFLRKKVPKLSKRDVGSNSKVADLILWFVENDYIVRGLTNTNCNVIFNEGFKPIIFKETNPENFKQNIKSLGEWFAIQVKVDLNGLKNISQVRFKEFLDGLGELSSQTLVAAGEVTVKYEMDMDNFSYDAEISKIVDKEERDRFKLNFLLDCVISSELRILAWVYYEWFDEWYKVE